LRILMVSPYPPIRDGIASYAVQEVAALIDAGDDVEVLSPGPSAAHHHLDLRGRRGPLALAKRVDRYDKVIIQFHPDVFYPPLPTDRERLRVTAGLLAVCARKRNVEVRVHELNFSWGKEAGLFGRVFRLLWRTPIDVTVHTAHERAELAAATGRAMERIHLMDHGRHFVRRATIDRAEARHRLGVEDDVFMFLAIGFIQPHKGFDRAVAAFDGLGDEGCRLDIVGSVRTDEPAFREYASSLRRQVAITPGAELHEEYVSDELFDVWLVAADVVVLPYRFIFSSGVLERAALYDTPVIATRVGGLDAQEHPDVRFVSDTAELSRAMRDAAGVSFRGAPLEAWPDLSSEDPDRRAIMAAVRDRAARAAHDNMATLRAWDEVRPANLSPLQRLAALGVPPPERHRPLVRKVKGLVRRLTAWEIDPIVQQVNALQRATIETLAPINHSDPERAAGDPDVIPTPNPWTT
jgi:glycosyltransferase involved in cell wall biosynthesis